MRMRVVQFHRALFFFFLLIFYLNVTSKSSQHCKRESTAWAFTKDTFKIKEVLKSG